ncbi:MAG: T9SS type A sorting domain-containing protein [Bacteroidetes bacterium]|nr:T9SS type A sorting domain-containing protein [Bacteroidota bacterium]
MKTLLLVLNLILLFPAVGQVSTFSKFYGKDSFYCASPTVIADGDSITLLGLFYGYNRQGHLFIKSDLNGNEAYRFVNGKPDTIFSGHYALCANRTSTGHFILSGGVARTGAQTGYDVLYKLKSNLDTEFVHTLNTASGCSYLPFASELSDKNYLLAGWRQDCVVGANRIATFIKTDTLGNIIWIKEEPHPNVSEFSSTSVISDRFYVMDQIATDGNTGDSVIQIHKYDNDGNLIWKRSFGHEGFNNKTGPLIPTHDGGAVYVLNIIDTNSILGHPTIYMPAIIYRLDSSGAILWQRWLNGANLFSIHETSSGSLVFCESRGGVVNEPEYSTKLSGELFKTDRDGNILWKKRYVEGVDSSQHNYFFDVTEGADCGIFATGQAVPLHGQRNQVWLLKVDSNGCLNGDCPELYTGIKDQEKAADIVVFPNPTQSYFIIAFSETSDFRRYREPVFRLTDVTGRTVSQSILTEQATTFSSEAFSSGVYFYTIRSDGRHIAGGKIVIRPQSQ